MTSSPAVAVSKTLFNIEASIPDIVPTGGQRHSAASQTLPGSGPRGFCPFETVLLRRGMRAVMAGTSNLPLEMQVDFRIYFGMKVKTREILISFASLFSANGRLTGMMRAGPAIECEPG